MTCICQEEHRRGYCTEPGCPYGNVHPARYVPEYQSIAKVVDRLRSGPLAGDPVFEDAADLIEALAIKVGRDGLHVVLVGSTGYYVPKPVMLEIEQRRQEVDALYRKSAKDVDNLRHWRNECGKLHAQLAKAKADLQSWEITAKRIEDAERPGDVECHTCEGSGEIFHGVGGPDDPERCHVCTGTGIVQRYIDDGSCIRCGSAPRNASVLCATCLDEDAARAGELDIEECGNHYAGSPSR